MVDYPTEDEDTSDQDLNIQGLHETDAEEIREQHEDAEWEQFEIDANKYIGD